MQSIIKQDQGWQQISYEQVINDLSNSLSLIYDWSEYLIVRTVIQELMGAQSHVGYYFNEVHNTPPPKLPPFSDFKTVYDSSMYQSTYNVIQICQQGETTYVSISLCGSQGASALTAYYRLCV